MSSGWFKSGFMWLLIAVAAAVILFTIFSPSKQAPPSMPIDQVASEAQAGRIRKITVSDDDLEIERVDGTEATSRKERNVGIVETLRDLGVSEEKIEAIRFEIEGPSEWGNWLGLLSGLLPAIFVGALLLLMMRQAQSSNSQALSFGRSRARLFTGDKPTVTFEDVAGVDEAKEELQEVVEFLKDPGRFTALGARIPKGVLLVGAPGTGKTLMARAVAGEAQVPFFSISGSEFVEMFVGVGASRVRDLFNQAKRHLPCIVFIDEIDAVGRHRGAGLGGSHDEREQTLNQILVEMDGFDTDTNIIIIAATNRPDILDPALLRPGRFDRRVVLDIPDMNGRKAILEVHARGKPLDEDADLMTLAKQTPGFTGADIENMVNEAAILATRRNKEAIGMAELEEAIERVIAGPERKSRLISDEEKRIIAYHEAGHALAIKMLPHCDPVHKVSIMSRGMALGYTMHLPKNDRYLQPRAKFVDELSGLLAGRAAEELTFGDVTTGAGSDLEQATMLARKMVCEYGMSEKLGPLTYGHKEELVFLGREIGEQRNYSEEIAYQIDQEVRNIITQAYDRAMEILKAHKDKLVEIAERLIEEETLEGEELEAMFN